MLATAAIVCSLSQRVVAGLDVAADLFYTYPEQQLQWLHKTFGCGTDDTPDVVVCDSGTAGCHDFALKNDIPFVMNVADVMSFLAWANVDTRLPPFLSAMAWKNISYDMVVQNRHDFSGTSATGLLYRCVLSLFVVGFRAYTASNLNGVPTRLGIPRSADLPQFGHSIAYQDTVLLQNTFWGFEFPRRQFSNMVMVGLMVPPATLARYGGLHPH